MRKFFVVVIALCAALQGADADFQAIADAISQVSYTATQQSMEKMGLGAYGGPFYNQGTRGRLFNGLLGDKGNQEARKFLQESFDGFGLQCSVQGKYLNLVIQQTGQVNPLNIVVVCAHYDSLSANAPGGDGDASGVAAVVECARVLSNYKFDNTIRYVLFNSDKGLRGANDYVRNIFGVGKETLVGVVDVNAILHPYHDKNPTLPQALAVNVSARSPSALAWNAGFVAAAQQFVPALPIDPKGPYLNAATDEFIFVTYGFTTALRLGENSGNQIANAALNTAADVSDGTAGQHYDYTFATNVTRAAAAFVAQQAGFEGPQTPQSAVLDTDGDGYSDEIELALGSDPNDPTSTPLGLPAATFGGALDTAAMVITVNFILTSADTISIRGLIPIPDGFVAVGQEVIVDVGGVVKAVKLHAGGTGVKGNNTIQLVIKHTGDTTPAQLASFGVTLGNGNFKRALLNYGFINGNFPGKPATIPLTIILNGKVYTTARGMLYAATKNMGGIAH